MGKSRAATSRPADSFSVGRASHLTGLSVPMLNYLCRNGIVVPSGQAQRGRGRPREYTFGDVVALKLVAKLAENGVSPLAMKNGLQGLRKLHPEITLTSLPGSHVITNGKDVYLREEGKPIERGFDGQFAFAFVVELGVLQREVAAEVAMLPPAVARRKTMAA